METVFAKPSTINILPPLMSLEESNSSNYSSISRNLAKNVRKTNEGGNSAALQSFQRLSESKTGIDRSQSSRSMHFPQNPQRLNSFETGETMIEDNWSLIELLSRNGSANSFRLPKSKTRVDSGISNGSTNGWNEKNSGMFRNASASSRISQPLYFDRKDSSTSSKSNCITTGQTPFQQHNHWMMGSGSRRIGRQEWKRLAEEEGPLNEAMEDLYELGSEYEDEDGRSTSDIFGGISSASSISWAEDAVETEQTLMLATLWNDVEAVCQGGDKPPTMSNDVFEECLEWRKAFPKESSSTEYLFDSMDVYLENEDDRSLTPTNDGTGLETSRKQGGLKSDKNWVQTTPVNDLVNSWLSQCHIQEEDEGSSTEDESEPENSTISPNQKNQSRKCAANFILESHRKQASSWTDFGLESQRNSTSKTEGSDRNQSVPKTIMRTPERQRQQSAASKMKEQLLQEIYFRRNDRAVSSALLSSSQLDSASFINESSGSSSSSVQTTGKDEIGPSGRRSSTIQPSSASVRKRCGSKSNSFPNDGRIRRTIDVETTEYLINQFPESLEPGSEGFHNTDEGGSNIDDVKIQQRRRPSNLPIPKEDRVRRNSSKPFLHWLFERSSTLPGASGEDN